MRSHEEVIKAFGGTRSLAQAIGIEPRLAVHWGRRGIPAKFWPDIEDTEKAQEHGITAKLLRKLPAATSQAPLISLQSGE